MTTNTKILYQSVGGSKAYGLSTPEYDTDIRGVFVNTDLSHLVGLKKDEVLIKQDESDDTVMTEFRHFLRLLRGGNTQMLELIFQEDYKIITPEWLSVTKYRSNLIDSDKLFSTLCGYMKSELRLANGERTGKLGGKRKALIDKYKFSPKNFVQFFRLAWCGSIYFQTGIFPVRIDSFDKDFSGFLMDIKTFPEKFNREQLNDTAGTYETMLIESYEGRKINTQFSEEIANKLCLNIYGGLIRKL